ncbi:MAG: PilT/PilU family type 4a pilus ATPase [Polyangiales bacterium]
MAIDIEQILRQMVQEKASDLFLAEGRCPSARINGALRPIGREPIDGAAIRALMDAVLRPTQREIFDRLGDLDVGMTRAGLGRFRVHFHLQRGLLGAVVRAVPGGALDFDQLGLPPVIRTLAECPRGLVLVSGSTGSGKSTTLAAMIHHINSRHRKHIVTLEDPIEFVHDDLQALVTQREVGSDTRDFALALRHVVRESPDVILIGEMRDAETMNVALSAALTGHLVLSSLHTIDAAQTLQRILAYYPEHMREQVCMDLSLSLQGVVAQRLVPKADGEGRVAAVEVMIATPAIKKLIREQRVDELADHMSSDTSDGMRTFNRALVELHEKGLVTYETGAAYASNPDEFRLAAQGMERGVEPSRRRPRRSRRWAPSTCARSSTWRCAAGRATSTWSSARHRSSASTAACGASRSTRSPPPTSADCSSRSSPCASASSSNSSASSISRSRSRGATASA